MFCGKCGAENPDDNKYCLNCGADLEKMRTPPPGGRKSIGEMKTVLSDEDISLLFDKGTLINDRYEMKALLGKGGMGVVYQVYDRLLREEAALKMMLPSLMMQKRAVERFIQEARISLHLSHENIVRVRDIGEFQSLRYISMEYVKGVTLRQLIDKKRRKGEAFSLDECWKIVIQIVEGLLYAHKRTVHRDIKPENIIITPKGLVKITDFGIAKAIDPTRFTSSSTSLGTAYYMAPEQTKASAEVDQRADIYSVGVIIYELLTGAIPMGSFESPHSINPQLPEVIDVIVERALKPIPEERYQSIAELKEELEGIGKAYLVSEEREPLKLKRLTKPPIIDANFIRCIGCYTNNPLERRFCYHCGANLKIACPKCERETRVDVTYCEECGVNILEAKEKKVRELEADAKAYIEAKDYEKVEKVMEGIAELDRKHPVISQLREGIEKKKEQVRKAEELVQKASALLKDERYQKAIDVAKAALELDRANQWAQLILKQALYKKRKEFIIRRIALMLIPIGVLFLLYNYDVRLDWLANLWPLIIACIIGYYLVRHFFVKRKGKADQEPPSVRGREIPARHLKPKLLFFELVLISIGVLFLIDNFTYIDVWYYAWRFWPVYLILYAVIKILQARSR